MKKMVAVLLILTMLLSLCACSAVEEPSSKILEVHITAGKIEPGMTAKDVFVEVTIDNQPVACRVKLTGFVWDGYWEMAEDEQTEVCCHFCNKKYIFSVKQLLSFSILSSNSCDLFFHIILPPDTKRFIKSILLYLNHNIANSIMQYIYYIML